jgi:hypothetical protein
VRTEEILNYIFFGAGEQHARSSCAGGKGACDEDWHECHGVTPTVDGMFALKALQCYAKKH